MWSKEKHDQLVSDYAAGKDRQQIFMEHLINMGWLVDQAEKWADYMAELVEAAARGEGSKKITSVDNIKTSVQTEVRLFKLLDFVRKVQKDPGFLKH